MRKTFLWVLWPVVSPVVSGPMFCPRKHQPCLYDAPDKPCVVTLSEVSHCPLADPGGAHRVRSPKGPNSFVSTYKFY